ncbi:hypothetical protein EZS27_002027 [termite gut metagenome]|uniref:Cell surface protein n=1 Tax=termite gut metagenome TaxID=433724 RepID=A0A5J4SWU3_9ZZZZ
MKRNLFNYVLSGVLAVVLSIGFAGCGEDYDDSKLTADIGAVKADLEKAKGDLESAKTSLSGQIADVKDAASAQAIEKSVEAIDKLLKGDAEEPVKFEDLAPILGQLIVLSGQLEGLESALESASRAKDLLLTKADTDKLTWAEVLIGYHTRIANLELQANVLGLAQKEDEGKYSFSEGLLKDIWSEITLLKGVAPGEGGEFNYDAIAKALIGVDEFIDTIIAAISDVNPDLVTLEAKINALITGISYYETGANRDLGFNLVTSLVDNTFGEGRSGAITFTTKKTGEGVTTASVIVQVTPANAVLNKDNVVLINSQGKTDVGEYIKAYNVEPYTDLALITSRAGTSASGLYKVTFTLDDKYDARKLGALTTKDKTTVNEGVVSGREVAFAIAVESKSDAGSRYVATVFNTGISVRSNPESIYNDWGYTADGKHVVTLRNKYEAGGSVKEKIWLSKTSAKSNVDPTIESSTKDAESDEQRKGAGKTILPVSLGEDLKVAIAGFAATADAGVVTAATGTDVVAAARKTILAYYIDFDTKFATDTEKALWTNASISGLDKVYSSDETAVITTSDPSLAGKEVGYRVYAVNYNGTLVDPDGKAFYVSYSKEALKGASLDFVYTVTTGTADELPVDGTKPAGVVTSTAIDLVYPEGLDVSKIDGYELSIDVKHHTPNNTNFNANDLVRYSATGEVHNWVDTKQLAVTNIDLTKLSDDGDTYPGTLSLKDASGHALINYPVTLKKVLPTKFPVDGLKLNNNRVIAANGYVNVTGVISTTYDFLGDLDNASPNATTFNAVASNLVFIAEYLGDDKKPTEEIIEYNGTAGPVVHKFEWSIAGVPTTLRSAFHQDIAVTVGYNYGAVSSDVAEYIVRSTLSYTLHFASSIEGAKYDWTSADVSWDKNATAVTNKLIYTKGTPTITWGSASYTPIASITMTIGSVSAPLKISDSSFGTTNALSDLYGGVVYGDAVNGGKLHFIDAEGNSLEVTLRVGNSGNVITVDIGDIVAGPGVDIDSVPDKDTFAPEKATLYLPIKDTAGNVWIEPIITFVPTVN